MLILIYIMLFFVAGIRLIDFLYYAWKGYTFELMVNLAEFSIMMLIIHFLSLSSPLL